MPVDITDVWHSKHFWAGSGITLYGVMLPSYTNFTVTIDGAAAPPPILAAPTGLRDPAVYNVTLYDIQDLPLSTHSLTLTLVAWIATNWSSIIFDYAVVNN